MFQITIDTPEKASASPVEMPRVRAATMEDFEQLLDMCAALHEENGVSNVDWDMVMQTIADGICNKGATIGLVASGDEIEGMIYLQISRMWYSQSPIIEELFNYVRPEYRRSNNAKALIDFAKRCSTHLGVPLLIGVISNERTEEKVRLYRRRLGPPAGAFFLVNAKTGQ